MQEIILSKIEILRRLNSMRINTKGLQPRNYGVSVKYYNANDLNKPEKRIDYSLNLDLALKNNKGLLTIDKTDIYYNQHEPDLINEIIASSITKSTYPLLVEINEIGRLKSSLINYKEILQRWKDEKSNIENKYASETLTTFFNKVDEKFKNQQQLENSLNYDWFWNLFFHPILINYGKSRSINTHLFLSVIPYQTPIRFSGIQTIERIPTSYHSCLISFKSEDQKAPNYFIPKNENSPVFMRLNVEYDIDIFHHFLMHLRATFFVYTKNSSGEETILKKIDFSLYQQNSEEYNNKQLGNDSPFITGGIDNSPESKIDEYDIFKDIKTDW